MTSKYKNIIHISNVNHSVTGFDSCVQVNRSHPWETLRWTATSRLNSADSRPCLLGDAASTNTGAEKTSPSGSGSPLAHHTVHNAHNVLLLWKSRGRTDGDGWQFAQLCHLQHELEDLPVVSFYQSACFLIIFQLWQFEQLQSLWNLSPSDGVCLNYINISTRLVSSEDHCNPAVFSN